MTDSKNLISHPHFKSYVYGFLLSIVFTLCSYFVVVLHQGSQHDLISHDIMIPLLLIFALSQFIVQSIFFLHLASEKGSRFKLIIFISTFSIILIIVGASLWIMANLNANMMPENQIEGYIIHREGIER